MNKYQWIIGGSLGIFLCATMIVLGQQHPPIERGQGRYIPPETPMHLALRKKIARLDQAAIDALKARDYAQEEENARQAVSLGPDSGIAHELLAQSLYDQGKDNEALQAYKVMADGNDFFSRIMLPYALLLLQSGQWAQAVNAYNNQLPDLAFGNLMQANSHFSPDVPQPKELEIAIHTALGLTYIHHSDWSGRMQNDKAMREFNQALRLAPESPLTNYYYGFGWQQLDPRSRLSLLNASRAKAALQKAAASEDSDIKKAAGETLQRLQWPIRSSTNA